MRSSGSARLRWPIDDAANVAVVAAGGLVVALFALALTMGELAGLVHEQLARIPH